MHSSPDFGVVIPAAGSGSRFGGGDKLLVDLSGETVLHRAARLFADHVAVAAIIVVTAPDRIAPYQQHLADLAPGRSLRVVEGGRERWESVMLGLRALAAIPAAPRFVAVHDAARPLTPRAVIDAAFDAARTHGGALPCVPEPATLKRRADDGSVAQTVDRRDLFQAQTPQCFELLRLLSAYETLHADGRLADVTDDAQLFERMQWPVQITPGAVENLKVTSAGDAAIARALLAVAPSAT
jgi:2-C-methyl-D-erythritol 4-phosphate cytidylyltransferase